MGSCHTRDMGLIVHARQQGSPPEGWEAQVKEIPGEDLGIVATFQYRRRGTSMVLMEVALRGARRPLESGDLQHRYPLASWEKAAKTAVLDLWRESQGEVVPRHRFEPVNPAEEQAAARLNRYAAIAAEYRANVKKGLRDPVAKIALRHGVKPSTARGWVYRSRKLGLLGNARVRTWGET
jgi:hypothetical protein